jgi:two-component system sensor kinase FixL
VEETAEGDLCCQVDRPRLTQAFRYLLHSALVSSSNPPHVTICCREGELAGEPAVEVSLRDQGPALSDEQRQQLFEPFAAPRPRRCGLGLAAARKIIEAHGGRIVAQPADGAGALVLITLPRRMS